MAVGRRLGDPVGRLVARCRGSALLFGIPLRIVVAKGDQRDGQGGSFVAPLATLINHSSRSPDLFRSIWCRDLSVRKCSYGLPSGCDSGPQRRHMHCWLIASRSQGPAIVPSRSPRLCSPKWRIARRTRVFLGVACPRGPSIQVFSPSLDPRWREFPASAQVARIRRFRFWSQE